MNYVFYGILLAVSGSDISGNKTRARHAPAGAGSKEPSIGKTKINVLQRNHYTPI